MSRWSFFPFAKRNDSASSRRCGLVVRALGSGGLEEVVAMLATELPAQGFETSVLCTHEGGAVAERLQRSGISVTVAKRSPRAWRSWVKQFRPTVLSTHFAPLKAVAVLSEWAPVVETVHNTYVWLSPAEWEEERAKSRLAKSLVAVSETVAAYHRRAIGPFHVSVIPNGVQGERLHAVPRADARVTLGLGADDVVFVHVGRFCVQKNQRGLVHALADILAEDPRARLLLVGNEDDSAYVDHIRRDAAELLARGALRLVPAMPDPSLVLSAADAFISNSFFEGWSLASTEALWMGRPVILSDCGGSVEQVGDDSRNGFVVPNPGGLPLTLDLQQVQQPSEAASITNRDAMRAAVRAFISQRAHWAGRSEPIMREARERWSAARMAESYVPVLLAAAGT
jgi:glycosyltransferase involved in cell wall biosynthesis